MDIDVSDLTPDTIAEGSDLHAAVSTPSAQAAKHAAVPTPSVQTTSVQAASGAIALTPSVQTPTKLDEFVLDVLLAQCSHATMSTRRRGDK